MRNPGWPFLVLLGLIAGVPKGDAFAAEGQSPAGRNNLQAVDYAALPSGGALVKVVFSQPLKAPPGILVNHHPGNSIAFDFPDTVSAAGKQPIEVAQRGLRSIQVVQSETRTRLVLNLDRPLVFETTLQGNELLITLRRPYPGAARDAPRWSDGASPGVPRHGLREVEFQRGDSGEGRIVVEVSDATVPIEVRRQGNTLVVDFFDAQVPRQLMRRLDLQDFGTPIQTVDTYPVGSHARLRVEFAGAGEISVYQFNRQLILTPHPEPLTK
jgi:type IV pilus assembly protein PilQ